jgi:hypothetical protein
VRRVAAAIAAAALALPATAAGHGTNYRKLWRTTISHADKAWYRATARCESNNNPWINTGNGYFGSLQWLPSTWRAATGYRYGPADLPIRHGRHEQAVVGVRWRNIAGRSQWPQCG